MSDGEIRSGVVRTRKHHSCEWCAEPIPQGSTVPARTYKFDGYIQNGWMHPECDEAMKSADRDILYEGWMPGDFCRGESGARE